MIAAMSPRARIGLVIAAVAVLAVLGFLVSRGGELGHSPRNIELVQEAVWTGAAGIDFEEPYAIAVERGSGDVLVTDVRNHRIVVLKPDSSVRRIIAPENAAEILRKPTGIAVAPDGGIWVADYDRDRIHHFSEQGEVIASWGESGSAAGQLSSPNGLAVDERGRVHVADFSNKLLKVFSITGDHIATIGKPGQVGAGALDYPTDVAIAADGRIIVADAYNHRIQVFDAQGEHLDSWGRHLAWSVPRPADAAEGFNVPTGACIVPGTGLIAVADSGNHRVVLLDQEGRVATSWHLPQETAWHSPLAVAAAPDGSRVYTTDFANNAVLVLRVDLQEDDE